jgi:hypothetical protein
MKLFCWLFWQKKKNKLLRLRNSHLIKETVAQTEKFLIHLSTTNSHPYDSPSITRTWYVTQECDMNRHCTLGSICTC